MTAISMQANLMLFSFFLYHFMFSPFEAFPLQDCKSGEIDLLIFLDVSSKQCKPERIYLGRLTKELMDNMFSRPEDNDQTRLRTGLARMSEQAPEMILPFKNYYELSGIIMKEDICVYTTAALRDALLFINSVFTERYGSRDNATHVAVMVTDRPTTVRELNAVPDGQYQLLQSDVNLFVVLVDQNTNHEGPGPVYNSWIVPEVERLANNQYLSMAICGLCRDGWFQYEHKNKQHLLSCYFLQGHENNIGWLRAEAQCRDMGAHLAAVETLEELQFLRYELFWRLQSFKLDEFYTPTEEGNGYVYVYIYIGLKRNDRDQKAKRFQWVNGNPLVVYYWLLGYPKWGELQECAAWIYQMPAQLPVISSKPDKAIDVLSDYLDSYKTGWVDVGCGKAPGKFSLCEATLHRQDIRSKVSLKPIPTNRSSYDAALKRGEVAEISSTIVSILPHLHKLRHSNYDLEKFSCSGEDYDQNIQEFIPYSFVCDHIEQCSNGRDESICQYRECNAGSEFRCSCQQCIPIEARCDMYEDCFDGSDEDNCAVCKGEECCSGNCIPKHWVRDWEIDCSGCNTVVDENDKYWNEISEMHDESQNAMSWIDQNENCIFICNRTQCVYPSLLNDGVVDCQGPEGPLDESIGRLRHLKECSISRRGGFIKNYPRLSHEDWAPGCIYVKDRYGGVLGCRDMSHLESCVEMNCPEGYVKCPDTYCIPLHYVHNNFPDCPMGEDELAMGLDCKGNFACSSSEICLHPDLVCDGHPHCPSSDDELNCGLSCARGFRCIGGTVTVDSYDLATPVSSLDFIDRRTRYLDLSGIDISSAISGHDSAHLDNLVNVSLSSCKIKHVGFELDDAFGSLQSVYWLNLSHNLITEVPVNNMFRHMTNLRFLDLSHNEELVELYEYAFSIGDSVYFDEIGGDSSQLEWLDLSYTSIYQFHRSVLHGLRKLNHLNLGHTRLVSLSVDTFPYGFSIQTLDLRGTPIVNFRSDSFSGLSIQSSLYTDSSSLCCPQIRGSGIPEHMCHAPTDAFSSCTDLIRDDIQRAMLWLMGLVALLGNAVVISYRLLWDRKMVKKAYVLFVINLGLSDFLMGIYLIIIAGADVSYRGIYVWNDSTWRESVVCKIAGFFSTISSETSTFFIFLITLDRLLVIKYPFGEHRISKMSMVVLTSLAWTVGFTLAAIPLLSIFGQRTIYTSNALCLGLPLTTKQLEGWEYSVAVFIVLNFTMFVMIAIGQLLIYRAMSVTRGRVLQSSARRAQDITVAKQLSLVILSDFLCWFPIGVMGLMTLSGIEIGRDAYEWSAVLVLPINSAINPLLYTIPIIMTKWKEFKSGQSSQMT